MLAQNRQQTGKSRPDDPTNTSIFAFDWCLHLFATTCLSCSCLYAASAVRPDTHRRM